MPVDTSMYGTQPPNMLATMGNMAQTGNLMNQNRMFQQEFAARRAMGPLYQQAINPETGELDTNKLLAGAAGNPDVAWKAGEIAEQALQRQSTQTSIQASQLQQAIDRQSQVRQTMAALLGDPNASTATVIDAAGQLVANKVLSPQQAAEALSSMPKDPAQLQGWLRQNMLQSMDGEAQLQALYGQTQILDTGNALVPMAVSPMAGTRQVGPAVGKAMSPGEAATPINVLGAGGQPGVITKGEFAGGAGTIPGDGRYPGGGANAPQNAPGFVPTALPAGASNVAEAAAERYNDAIATAQRVPDVVNGYDRALDAIGETMTGPGASSVAGVNAVMNTFGLAPGKDMTENFQSLRKYLNNAAATAAADAGYSGSDARYEGFGKGQPDVETMNPRPLAEAILYVKAQEMGKQARANAMTGFLDRNGGNYTELPKFETAWSKAYNPDVMFMRALGSPEEQAEFLSKLPERRIEAAKRDYPKMMELGAFD